MMSDSRVSTQTIEIMVWKNAIVATPDEAAESALTSTLHRIHAVVSCETPAALFPFTGCLLTKYRTVARRRRGAPCAAVRCVRPRPSHAICCISGPLHLRASLLLYSTIDGLLHHCLRLLTCAQTRNNNLTMLSKEMGILASLQCCSDRMQWTDCQIFGSS
ncbi:uncharacterized protein LOC113521438 isoform X1 [Galleria mellonella]|uniref:Uncharacterized protein LOC113521438 isoform X1 n=1 Tax=Galleria mellonella TaxID=7137 RepID=A0A6J1X7K0_GALME|nr:uncharacterized protein LOC113521438 isoform X1 [Galleria mellonella]XP_031768550.1 uncharacterized protein LOC113521438 isoform X1 [Galleria mellonella]